MTQAFLGTSGPFLTNIHQPIPPAGASLLLDLRTFLKEVGGSLHLPSEMSPLRLRCHDRFIMDIALSQSQWKKHHIVQINSCRRFLQSQTLADITTVQGTRWLPHATRGDHLTTISTTQFSCFNQKLPSEKAWRTWRRFLLTISNTHGVLYQSLGPWLVDISHVRHFTKFVYDPVTDQLYSHHQYQEYHQHARLSPGTFEIKKSDDTHQAQGYPTSTHITMGTLRPAMNFESSDVTPTSTTTILTHEFHLPSWEQEILEHHTILAPTEIILSSIKTGNIVMCSDGSVRNGCGSFGYIMATKMGRRLVRGFGPAPGSYANSFRSEAYGVLAAIRWLHQAITIQPPDHQYTIQLFLDNQSVINRIEQMGKFSIMAPNQALQPEQDVIREIAESLKMLTLKITPTWAPG